LNPSERARQQQRQLPPVNRVLVLATSLTASFPRNCAAHSRRRHPLLPLEVCAPEHLTAEFDEDCLYRDCQSNELPEESVCEQPLKEPLPELRDSRVKLIEDRCDSMEWFIEVATTLDGRHKPAFLELLTASPCIPAAVLGRLSRFQR
jgi:hypothetical protein